MVVMNVDLKDFFDNTKSHRVFRYWVGEGWSHEAALTLTNICCLDGRLPQGAPTSPALSNLVNRYLDSRLEKLARTLGGRYTRYADDITISFQAKFGPKQRKLIPKLREILSQEGYAVQEQKKVRIQRAHQKQTTTGLIVNSHVNLPRATRRKIRAMQHRQRLGKLSESEEARLAGYEALVHMVEKGNEDARMSRARPALPQSAVQERYRSGILAIFGDDSRQAVAGTGFLVWAGDELVAVTCAHVVQSMKKVVGTDVSMRLLRAMDRVLKATVVWLPAQGSPDSGNWEARQDVCLLRLAPSVTELSHSDFLSLTSVTPQDYAKQKDCWCFGFPKSKGLRGDYIAGIACDQEVALGYIKLLQPRSDADKGAIEPGVSGAPLTNPQGQLIGMINSVFNKSSTQVAYLIPSVLILEALSSLSRQTR
jgi:hypothetical protein